jgi:hypothetical protein
MFWFSASSPTSACAWLLVTLAVSALFFFHALLYMRHRAWCSASG